MNKEHIIKIAKSDWLFPWRIIARVTVTIAFFKPELAKCFETYTRLHSFDLSMSLLFCWYTVRSHLGRTSKHIGNTNTAGTMAMQRLHLSIKALISGVETCEVGRYKLTSE